MKPELLYAGFFVVLGASVCVLSLLGSSNKINLQQQSNGIAVLVNGQQVGLAASVNLISGTGIIQVCALNGARIDCTPGINSAAFPTFNQAMSMNTCALTSSGVSSFTCTMKWSMAQSQPTWFWFTPDATVAGSATMAVDSAFKFNIKKSDGQTDPGSGLTAGRPALLFFDGKVYRQMI